MKKSTGAAACFLLFVTFVDRGEMQTTFPLFASYSTDGIRSFNSSGHSTGTYSNSTIPAIPYATGITVDSSGYVFVASSTQNKVFRLSPDLSIATVFASSLLSQPQGLAIDSFGYLYVASAATNSIVKFDQLGNGTVFASGLSNPIGLVFDASNNLYVANYSNSSIVKIDPTGNSTLFATTNLSNPHGLAIDSSGNIYAANWNAMAGYAKFNSAGQFVSARLIGNSSTTFGIALDASDNIYLSVWGSHIEKFSSSNVDLGVFASDAGLGSSYLAFGSTSSVPEPATYAAIFALTSLAVAVYLRWPSHRNRS